ncbi:nardilysin [Macrosteles quadrilineatus]|uniref:nardilysin n=1 Tax=Macrosteles quadrilineatus TaxID=74068 RepID=UPI0023E0F79A|nr:nardilysin [Macrosteles quadrilineatus]
MIKDALVRLEPPNKSQSDVKEYSVIKLPNGLTALLISDKSQIINLDELNESSESESSDSESSESGSSSQNEVSEDEDDVPKKTINCDQKLAACALCIGVGSFSDPEEIPGLAHFLEHMIFMGSEKYPKENEFDTFIKKKGGSDNASTECEYTTFYFDCHEAHLCGAMEIFSQLFISPLMLRDTMTKEREAIESEFQMSLPSDESRKSQLLCSLADVSNPSHKFMWGNLITLRDNVSDDELYEAVHEFRKRHYSAHRMTLAVQARLPLETLESWVLKCFKDVPNNELPPDRFNLNVSPFRKDDFRKMYIVNPVKNVNNVDLTWVLPSTLKMYRTKPLNYLSWVIGHEGKGSLISFLREKMWGFDITVSSGGDGTEENTLYTLFTISLVLSEEGIKHIKEILSVVFEYLKMFQQEGPQERLFKEMQLIAETSFRFAEEISSAENVEQLAENMHFYESRDYITGMELFYEYNAVAIRSFLNDLRPNNVNIMISSKIAASNEILDKEEKWYGTKYCVKEIPADWLEQWKNIQTTEKFHLPEENTFIPTDFSILETPQTPDEYPVSLVKNSLSEVWYKQDVTFKLPNAFCCVKLVSPFAFVSPQNAAALDLYITLLKQSLVEELYPANVAQLEYGFHSGEKGIVLVINGFNQKLKKLLHAILRGMKSLTNNVKEKLFDVMKMEQIKGYSNGNLKTGFLAREIRMSILLETYWTALNKEVAISDLTFEKFKDLMAEYFQQMYVQCLVQGNISKEEAIEYAELVKNELSFNPLPSDIKPKIRVHQLPIGEKFCVVKSFNIGDSNSIVTNYYQSGPGSIQESCVIEMLLMLMEEPIFDALRTKQQLGYDVSCSLRDTFGILGFSLTVNCQSDRNSPEFVEGRITEFLHDFFQKLKDYPMDEFTEMQESLIKLKKCMDNHLKEEVKRNWQEIKSEEYIFDRHHKERELIEKLTLEEVIEWFKITAGLENSNCKKLSTQVVGKLEEDNSDGPRKDDSKTTLNFLHKQETSDKYIYCVKSFKESLTLYPPHKIT